MNVFNIANAYQLKKERGWDTLYWAIDLHDTLFKGNYARDQKITYYPDAIEVLHHLSQHVPGNVLIAYTSSYPDTITRLRNDLNNLYGVTFKYVNENPEYTSTEYADFSRKFYYNILLDDKAGFVGATDWELVKNELIKVGEW